MLRNGLTPSAVAEKVGVDPKTVERWITQGRPTYPKFRHAVAAMVKESESYLWPNAIPPERAARVAQSELVTLYPCRSVVPEALWNRLFNEATEQISILVYAGLFLPEQRPKLVRELKAKAAAGAKVSVLLGDPDCDEVRRRGMDEGIGDAVPTKIRNVLTFYRPLQGVRGVDVRFHRTTLYNSIYRFDDEMLVNTHVFGFPAAHAPVLHLRRLAGGDLFEMYTDSVDRVLAGSVPAWTEAVAA
nr:XRE family transcriptional regulator [Planosporangium thailandense]